MDSLSEQQRELIQKMSDERLRQKLTTAGMPTAVISTLSRPLLLEAWAELVASGREKPSPAAAMVPMADPQLEKRRLDFEERKWAEEMKLENEKLKLEHDKMAEEMKIRNESLAAQQQQLSLDAEKVKLERERLRLQAEAAENPAAQAKKYGDALRGVLGRMPTDAADLPAFFENAERLFDNIGAPAEFQAQLLLPYLTDKARALVGRMDKTKASTYKEVKDLLLREYKLTPWAYLTRYQTATKHCDETYVMFVSRLTTLLKYYVASRKVTTFDNLLSLLVADHVKPMLPPDCLKHILAVENTATDGWLSHSKLAEVVDTYIASHNTDVKSHTDVAYIHTPSTKPAVYNDKFRTGKPQQQGKPERRCFECDSRLHTIKHCPHRNSGRKFGERFPTKQYTNSSQHNTARINAAMSVTPATAKSDVQTNTSASHDAVAMHVNIAPTQTVELDTQSISTLCNDSCSLHEADIPIMHNAKYEIADLAYIDVHIDGLSTPVKALHDSGAMISVIHPRIIQNINSHIPCEGTIKLRGLFGEPVNADLVTLFITTPDHMGDSISVVMAMTSEVNNDLILTDPVVKVLLSAKQNNAEQFTQQDICVHNDTITDTSISDDEKTTDTDDEIDSSIMNTNDSHRALNIVELRQEQKQDTTLSGSWALAAKTKGGYYVKNDLLYHSGTVAGQLCEQLCVPLTRRLQVLTLAHEVYGAHLGPIKTRDRIRLSFYWPTLTADCKRHSRTCEQCQKRARTTVLDRVPISPIPRADEVFSHWFMDCLGPLFPNQKVRYNYCLLLCDSTSRWPAAYPLHSLSAKSVCDALLQQFAQTGIPHIISSDNATNFKGNLTREFLKRLGCCPRFSTPAHPQACGLVERLVGSIKSAISKVAIDHPKQWYTHLACILWAFRESVNETTGVPPWLLAFGRLPKGPLAVLKDTWTGEEDPPLNLGKGVVEYLRELRERFKSAEQYASSHAAKKQAQYTTRYNLRSQDKVFSVGEQVLVLVPDSTASKTFSRWQGPATVVLKKSPYSYIVELNGTNHHMHANKLRKFNYRIQKVTCEIPMTAGCNSAIIYEKDSDFGQVIVPETKSLPDNCKPPSEHIEESKLLHLEPEQRAELQKLLDKYADCFSDVPGFCSLVEHTVPLLNSFVPKRLAPYKIPINLRPEVEQQLQDLLDLGLIRHSKSPMASPVVCVLKGKDGKGGVRLAVDYRYVNRYTVADAYPLPDVADIVQEVGKARFISTFDATKGYYQTAVRESDCWLTAFICEFGLFEFTRTPFGMRSSGSTFVRAMQQVLQPVRKFTASFVDDMSVYSGTWHNHLDHVEQFLQQIRKSGFTLNLKKCNFALSEVLFVGQIIGSGFRRADPDKMASVENMATPVNKKQVRQVLGFFSYFREFIPGFSQHAYPLTELTKKGCPDKVIWGPKEQQGFDRLKALLINAASTPLTVIDCTKPFTICVDASDYAVAAAVTQLDENGRAKPVAFASVKLSPTQSKWATVEKEAYAAIWALQKFQRWIFWCPVTLMSDHNPLTFLTQASPRSAKLMRWTLALSEFNVTFKYKEGKINTAADCLSRIGPHPILLTE